MQSMSSVDASDAGTAQFREATEVVRLTNVERSNARLREFRANPRLMRAAQIHAEQMAEVGRMAHELPGSRYPRAADRLAAAGYVWSAYAENVATGRAMTPATAVSGWMRSAGHRANILNARYTELGAGYAVNARGERHYVQVFGDPAR